MSRWWPELDPTTSWLGQLLARGWAWSTATSRRRIFAAPVFVHAVIYGAAALFPPSALAAAEGAQRDSLLAMLGVVDSYGVPLANYTFTTDYGSVLDFGTKSVLATLLQMEAAFFVSIGGFAVWMLTYAISFGFLPDLVVPVADVVQDLAGYIIPGVAAIAAVVAALFIAFNVMRGNASRAASQTLAAMLVAIVTAALLQAPITWAISPGGPLMTGRDVAIGLGANTVPSSAQTVNYPSKLAGDLATAFVRRPLQMWNLASIADDTPACAQAWSTGVMSGDQDQIKDRIARCGSPASAAMKTAADRPNPGQLGTGLLLLLFVGIFALFCLVMAMHIIGEFFRVVANAVRLLWDAALGVIPGAAQSNLLNTFVAVMFSAVAMFAYITFTVLVGETVGRVFSRVGNGVGGMISALILMVMALVGVSKVSRGLKRSSAATTAGILSGIGAPQVQERPHILQEKSSAVMAAAGAVTTGLVGTAAGMALARRVPALAPALVTAKEHLPAQFKTVRMLGAGAAKQQKRANASTPGPAPAAGSTPPAGPTAAPATSSSGPATSPTAAGTSPAGAAAAAASSATPPAATTSTPPASSAAAPAGSSPSTIRAAGMPASNPTPPAPTTGPTPLKPPANSPDDTSPGRPMTGPSAVALPPEAPAAPPSPTATTPQLTPPGTAVSSGDATSPGAVPPAPPVLPAPFEPNPAPAPTRPVTGQGGALPDSADDPAAAPPAPHEEER